MWVPSASQARSSTGVAEEVAVTTMPAPATASAADPQARHGQPGHGGELRSRLRRAAWRTARDPDPGQRPARAA